MAKNLIDDVSFELEEGVTKEEITDIENKANAAYNAVDDLNNRLVELEQTYQTMGVRIGEHGLAIYQLQLAVEELNNKISTLESGNWVELFSGYADSGNITLSESFENFTDVVFVDSRGSIAIVHVGEQGESSVAANPWTTLKTARRTSFVMSSYNKQESHNYGYWYLNYGVVNAIDETILTVESLKALHMGVGGNTGSGVWLTDSNVFGITKVYGVGRIGSAE